MTMEVLPIAAVGIFILLVVFMTTGACFEHQEELASKAGSLQAQLDEKSATKPVLEDALRHLKRARDVVQAEHIKLSGDRDDFLHAVELAKAVRASRTKGGDGQRAFIRQQMTHAGQELALSNRIDREKDNAALRPLRFEAEKTQLRVQADERVVESILTQQAIDEARRRGAPRASPAAPLQGAMQVIAEAIEQRQADGKETDDLAQALDALRTITSEIPMRSRHPQQGQK
jgi:hypothetical protein